MTRMPSDADPLEREIREALARETAEPAPDRLVARIARSRAEARPPANGLARMRARITPAMGFGLPLAVGLAAIAVLTFAGGSILPSGPAATPVLPGATGTPGASSTPGASVAPASPSAAPASRAPAGTPAASASPASDGTSAGRVPPDFQPVSVTFVSASRGWLLGTTTCAGSSCAAILRTTDGGLTWARIPAPPTAVEAGGPAGAGVRALRFASSLDGWAFGPELWVTHDGGTTWNRETLPSETVTGVMTLEAAAGTVHVAYVPDGSDIIAIASGPVTGSVLRAHPIGVTVGAGPVPETQIVLHGSSGWLMQVDRAVVGGARLSSGAWGAWQPPCLDTAGPAWLAASSGTDLAAACDIGVWSTPEGVHLFTSSDAGATFTQRAPAVPITDLMGIAAAPAASTIVVAGSLTGGGAALEATFDAGRTWSRVATLPGNSVFFELGFTTEKQGVAVARTGDGGGRLVMTRDGGHTWSVVDLAGS